MFSPQFFIDRWFPLSYEKVGNLSYNLATCLAAGVALPQAFRTTTRSLAKSDWGKWDEAAERLEHGESLSEALQSVADRLPPFILPLVQAGEATGRLDEVFRYLADHCRLLARPARAVRNVWLVPLAIFLCGIPLKLGLTLWFGSWNALWNSLIDAFATCGSLVTIAILIVAPPLKPAWDRIKSLIPVLGRSEREISASRFLRVFSMLYATGGMRVESMIRFAARSISNDYFQRDILQSTRRIERGETLAQAISACVLLTRDEQQTIAAGEISGTIEAACQRLAASLDDSLEARMKVVTAFAVRITMFMMTMSIASLIIHLLMATFSSQLGQF